MTPRPIRRCKHCGDPYVYQTATRNTGPYNHEVYCPTCWCTVVRTLQRVPLKVRHEWRRTTVVPLDTLLQWEQRQKKQDTLPVIRTLDAAPSSDTQDLSGYVQGQGIYQYRVFRYRYWPDKPHEAVVEEEVGVDATTGATRPWDLQAKWRDLEFHDTQPSLSAQQPDAPVTGTVTPAGDTQPSMGVVRPKA